MSKLLNLLTGGGTSLIDKAVDIADKFIETPEEKKAFIEKAYEQEIEDRRAARDLGKNLSEVQKGLITTFSGFFLRTLGDVYGYWFGSSMGSTDKTKDLTKLMRK